MPLVADALEQLDGAAVIDAALADGAELEAAVVLPAVMEVDVADVGLHGLECLVDGHARAGRVHYVPVDLDGGMIDPPNHLDEMVRIAPTVVGLYT